MMWWRTVAIVFLGSIFSSVFIGFYGLGHPSPQVQTYTLTAMGSAFSILCAICLFEACRIILRVFIFNLLFGADRPSRTVANIGHTRQDIAGFLFFYIVFYQVPVYLIHTGTPATLEGRSATKLERHLSEARTHRAVGVVAHLLTIQRISAFELFSLKHIVLKSADATLVALSTPVYVLLFLTGVHHLFGQARVSFGITAEKGHLEAALRHGEDECVALTIGNLIAWSIRAIINLENGGKAVLDQVDVLKIQSQSYEALVDIEYSWRNHEKTFQKEMILVISAVFFGAVWMYGHKSHSEGVKPAPPVRAELSEIAARARTGKPAPLNPGAARGRLENREFLRPADSEGDHEGDH